MEMPVKFFNRAEYVETASGNKVSKETTLSGSQNIMLNGRTILMSGCVIRGDLANIRMGRYCVIGSGTTIRPSPKKFPKGVAFVPVHMGDHVYVEEDVVIMAAQVGSYVHIGKGAVIGERVIVKDAVEIRPGTVIPPDTVVPPFSVLAGNPARLVDRLSPATQELMTDATTSAYNNFRPQPTPVN